MRATMIRAGAAGAAVGMLATAGGAAAPAVKTRAQSFPPTEVRLLDGPFKDAQELSRKYLLSLDPDRLLHNFRVNAGLPSAAEPLGGWEDPKGELHGHAVGHYLSGAAWMYAATGDEELRRRAEKIVAGFAECQARSPERGFHEGYLSAFPESFLDRVETTGKVWAPWYTLHKILAGLLDVHRLCGSTQALDVARRMGAWADWRTARLDDATMQKMLDVEWGGMNDALAELYAATGDPAMLAAAKRFHHHRVFDPLAAGEDRLPGLHANTQIPKAIGAARIHELDGDPAMLAVARNFWTFVTRDHSYCIGGHSDNEHFGPSRQLARRLSPVTAETCNTYNMLKLTGRLFEITPDAALADYAERALFNHILASIEPQQGMVTYFMSLKPGHFKTWSTPLDSFWCCVGTGMENHARYNGAVYAHDDAGVWVNQFIASTLDWKERGLKLRLETRFPDEPSARMVVEAAPAGPLALRIRRPAWAGDGFAVRTGGNGAPAAAGAPGSYVVLERAWKAGDVVEIALPMRLALEPTPDDPTKAAVLCGPIVLAGVLGREGIVPPMPYAKNQQDYREVPAPEVPVLVTGGRPPADWLRPVPGEPLAYRTEGVGRPADATLRPLFRIPYDRYTVYWDLLTPEQIGQRAARERAEKERRASLAAITADAVEIGREADERAHGLKQERSGQGSFRERPWRDAREGGWFSWRLKPPAVGATALRVTYWGGDGGGREFDVLVDGAVVGTEKLERRKPGEFFDVVYALDPERTRGREAVEVRFQAKPDRIAGGVFDCRILKR